jgi:hypothetical protein
MSTLLKGESGLHGILKLDMSKAHDRAKWCFLKAVMRKIGFDTQWIHLMMMCSQLVTYSILLNGEPYGRVIPTRGIQKGDSLSHIY